MSTSNVTGRVRDSVFLGLSQGKGLCASLPCGTTGSKQIAIRYHWFCSHLGLKDGNGIIIKDVALALNKMDYLKSV